MINLDILIYDAEKNDKLLCIHDFLHSEMEKKHFAVCPCEIDRENIDKFISDGNEEKMLYIAAENVEKSVVNVRTFGRFEVFINNYAVDFHSSKAKELFALCIDRRGRNISIQEAADVLWENRPFDIKVKKLYNKAVMDIRKTFSRFGITNMIHTSRGYCNVNMNLIDCDYFLFLENDAERIRQFNGSYMAEYSWAEETLAYLVRINEK